MWISHSNFNTISGNIANETSRGISLDSSADNNFSGNIVAFNSVSGFYECRACRRNLIFNNYANNSLNADINTVDTTWNIEKTPGTNIVGGPFLGGNFWANLEAMDFHRLQLTETKTGLLILRILATYRTLQIICLLYQFPTLKSQSQFYLLQTSVPM